MQLSSYVFWQPVAAVLALLLCVGPAQALDPVVPLHQLHHDAWSGKDGMPGNVWDMT
jgi:hypothetical protein